MAQNILTVSFINGGVVKCFSMRYGVRSTVYRIIVAIVIKANVSNVVGHKASVIFCLQVPSLIFFDVRAYDIIINEWAIDKLLT